MGLGYGTIDLHYSWPYGDLRKNRPPRFAHVVVEGGRLVDLPRPPQGAPAAGSGAGLLQRAAREPVLVERVRWGGRVGDVVLAQPFERSSSIHGGHLIFVWRADRREYAVSLHVWVPIREALATLRAVIESVPVP